MRRRTHVLSAALTGLSLFTAPAWGAWIGASSGTTNDVSHTYTNTANWGGSTIDDSFTGASFSAATTLYFHEDHATGPGGLLINPTAQTGTLTLTGGGTFNSTPASAHTLTLNGDLVAPGSAAVAIGVFGGANGVNIDLNGATRTFSNAPTLNMFNGISNGGVIKEGAGVLQYQGQATFAGPLTVRRGTFALQNAGTLATNEINIAPSQGSGAVSFTLTYSATAPLADRIGDTATINFYGGGFGPANTDVATLSFGNATANSVQTETIGTVRLVTGLTRMSQAPSAGAFTGGFDNTITTLDRVNGSVAVLVDSSTVSQPDLGTNGATPNRLTVGNGNSYLSGSTPGGTGTSRQIIPFLIGSSTSSFTNTDSFITHTADGLDILDLTTEYFQATSNNLSSAGATRNVRVTVADNSVTTDKTINSLTNNGVVTLSAKLTISSGAMTGNSHILGGSIDFGANEGMVWFNGGRTISSALVNDPGNTKGITYATHAGSATAVISGVNTYDGPTNIVTKTLRFSGGSAIPDASDVTLHPGAAMTIGASNARALEQIASLSGGSLTQAALVRLGNVNSATLSSALIIGSDPGAANNKVSLAGGILSPGLGAGDTRFGNLSLGFEEQAALNNIDLDMMSGTFIVDIGDETSDLLSALGQVTILDDVILSVRAGSYTPTNGEEWTIVTAGSVVNDGLPDLFASIQSDLPGITYEARIEGSNTLIITAVVPEPGVAGMLGVIGSALALRRRRKA